MRLLGSILVVVVSKDLDFHQRSVDQTRLRESQTPVLLSPHLPDKRLQRFCGTMAVGNALSAPVSSGNTCENA